MSRDFELPVDVPKKSEIVQQRVSTIIIVSVLALIVFILFLLSVNIGLILAKGTASLPDIRILEKFHPNQSTRIFDRYGKLVANIHGDEDRVVVPLSKISPNVQRALMAIEDNRFYQHNGVDIRGTFRALATNIKGGDVQGGSTVTQQLVKNLFLSPERSYSRKIAEALLALRVEKEYPKDKILEMYLNQVYWGNQAYGIEKAARRYFRKPASELTIGESALLAGLLKAPEGLSPYSYPKAARERQLEVIGKMLENGYISAAQAKEAQREPIKLNTRQTKASKYPYYVTFVIQELVNRFGEDVVRRGGLQVFTYLDPAIQEGAEQALYKKVTGFSKGSNVTTGALVAIDVRHSEIVAMVGGVDFEKSQFNNATQARRAAGSQFKPFVYLTAFRLGILTPESPISDRPVSFNTGYGIWHPKNWDGRFMGPMTVRKALALSRNTTTVQVGMKVGIDEVIKTARLAGIKSPIDRNFSSLLGSSGISPLEMCEAFTTFARNGVRTESSAIQKVVAVDGTVLKMKRSKPKQTLEPESVAKINSILVDVVEEGTGKSARLPERQVAGKTGTTDRVRDIWFTGYTPDMVATVWMGSQNYVPLNGAFSFHSAEVWHDFAENYYAVRQIRASEFPKPNNTNQVRQQDALVLNLNSEASRPRTSAVMPLEGPPSLEANPNLTPDPNVPNPGNKRFVTFDYQYDSPLNKMNKEKPTSAEANAAVGPPVPGGQ